MENHAVDVSNLAKTYDGLKALKGVNFFLKKGEIFGYLGPNGAGKTTTVRIISGLSRADRGKVMILGHDGGREPIWIKQHIGLVPETSNLYPELTALNNLLFLAGIYGITKRMRRERAEELLHEFGLSEKRDVLFSRLSKGMKRRLTIAASLIHKPEIVFLDEPTAGLDVASARHLRALILRLHKSGATIFLTTHNIQEAEALCQRVAVIVKGKIVALDTVTALKKAAPALQKLIFSVDKETKNLSQSLSGLAGVKDCRVEGTRIELHCEDINLALSEALRVLNENEIKVQEVHTASASLEDTFVHLTGIDLELMKIDKERKA